MPILGVVKLVPVPKAVPPVGLAYQFKVPALAVAEIVNESPLQILIGVVEVIVGMAFTVAVTKVRAEVQLPLIAST